MQTRVFPFAFACAPCAFSVLSMAIAPPALPAENDDSLNEVVVVANRAPEPLSKVGNSVTVLDQQAIQESQKVELSELLATTPGITFSRNGGPGNSTSVYIRGANSDHTVVLIDGVVLNDPSLVGGNLDFGNLLVGDVSRIEILRGAQSTLYGSQAIGGVINIITTEPQPGLGADVQAEGGSLGTGMVKGGIGDKSDNWSFRLGATYYATDSIPTLDKHYGGTLSDPFHDSVVSGRATYNFTPDVQFDERAYWTESRVFYDGYSPITFLLANYPQYEDVRQLFDYTGFNFNFFDDQLKNRVAYEYTTTQHSDYNSAVDPVTQTDSYRGDNSRVEYQGTWAVADGYQAVFGIQQEKSWADITPYAPAHAETGQVGEYVQLQGQIIPGLTLTAGERHDHYDSFGQHYTGQFAAAWSLPSSTVLRASWSQGYKAPSLYELYSPYGNSTLNPEESTGGDGSVEQHLWNDRITLSATYFLTHFKNLIEFEDCPGSPLCATIGQAGGYYANLDRAKASGVELQASAALNSALAVSANYSHIKTLDETPGSPTDGRQLFQRAEDAANLSLSYTWPHSVETTVAARYGGPSLDQNFNVFPTATVRLGGYTLLDLRVSYPVTDKLELYARVDNATNKWYETIYQYGTWGRTAFFGLRAKL
ncbi:MAG: TonB-dependent receptor [Steroidobacteraceae bacterium]